MDIQERAWMEIDTHALIQNYQNLISFLPKDTGCICIVKANGYGHDAVQEALILQQQGAHFFGVATLAEAVQLKEANIKGDILILGHTLPRQMKELAQYDLIQTVGDVAYGYQLAEEAKRLEARVRIHLKIDTGMHRLGIDHRLSMDTLKALIEQPSLKLEGCFSHFACADSVDENDVAFTHQQAEKFAEWVKRARLAHIPVGKLHLSASAAIVNYPEFQWDYCRPGILLLGFDSGDMKHPYERNQVLSIYAKVTKIDVLPKQETIGYGRTYQAKQLRKVATISIGYGDGIPRNYQNGEVLIRDARCPIIGRISMDQLCCDVTDLPEVALFDLVTIIGNDQKESIRLEEMANKCGTITNEIVTHFSNRLPRIYR
ncbi:MAG: alanine racemase [Erysipelotrichaceae bacterium]|nr:alanine racemase [Erysipelotrichaceae bacterium]